MLYFEQGLDSSIEVDTYSSYTVTFLVSYTQYYTPESRILQNALLHYSFKQPTTSSIFWKSIRSMSVSSSTFPSLLLSFPSRRLLLFWYGSYQSMRLLIVVCFVSPFSFFIPILAATLLLLASVLPSVVCSTFPYFQDILWIIRYFLFSWPAFPLVWWHKKKEYDFFRFVTY